MGNFKEDIANVKAFVFDVDGVFTDGGLTITNDGDFIRTYNAKDGYSVAYALKQGFKVAIISGGRGASLELRFEMLGVTAIYPNCYDKMAALKEFLSLNELNPEEVLYMGDDIPDLEVMRYVGIATCPNDAVAEVIEAARYVSQYNGGRGCVRDIVEQTLRAQDKWAKHSFGVNCVPSA